MIFAISALFGLAVALGVYALRRPLVKKFQSDVAWLQHTLWLFKPDTENKVSYVGWYYGVAIGVAVAIWLLSTSPIFVGLWLLAAQLGPRLYADRAWKKRKETVNEQLPASVRQLASSVGSGMSIAQAIERQSLRAEHPTRMEFFVVANYWKMGADFATSIQDAKRRLDLPSFDLFSAALLVNQQMGGNLTATLNRLAHSLDEIDRMQREVKAATAEGRMNIKVLAVAPVMILGLVAAMDYEAVVLLFTKPIGQAILGVCALLTFIGTYWAWQIVESDV